MIKMRCRKALMDDLEGILKLRDITKADIILKGLDIWQKDYPNDELIKSDIDNEYAYIIENDKEVLAYMALIPTDIDYGKGFYEDLNLLSFSRIMTSPNHRHQGLGKMMIEEAINKAKDYDGLGITVDDINERAVCLYKSFGFKKIGQMRIREAKNVLDKYLRLND